MKIKVDLSVSFQLRAEGETQGKDYTSLDTLVKDVKKKAQAAFENMDCGFTYGVFVVSRTPRAVSHFEQLNGISEADIVRADHILNINYTDGELSVCKA